MGILSGIKAFFSTPDTIKQVVSDVSSGLDKAFYTDQEKAANQNKINDWYLKYLEATQPQNQARRLIAVGIVFVFLFLVLMMVVVWPFSKPYAEYILTVVDKVLWSLVETVMAFYFLKHVVTHSTFGKKG